MPVTWRHHRHPIPKGTVPPPVLRNWNPGHYVWPSFAQTQSSIGQDSGTVTIAPYGLINYANTGVPGGHTGNAGPWTANTTGPVTTGVKGIGMPYYWRDLEPTKGSYDFTQIDADIAVCKALGVQLIIMVVMRTFTNDVAHNCAPGDASGATDNTRYLNQLPYSFNYTESGGGYQISRWNTTGQNVQARYTALITQLENRYGTDPTVEGIATQETAGNFTATEIANTGYTPTLYYAALTFEVDLIKAAGAKLRHFGYANDMHGTGGDGFITQYYQYMAASNCSVGGGPDILPDNSGLNPRVYQNYADVVANTHPTDGPLFCSVQNTSFQQGTRSLLELFQWSSGTTLSSPSLPASYIKFLRLDYIFWNLVTNGAPQFAPDAALVIAANPSGWGHYAYP